MRPFTTRTKVWRCEDADWNHLLQEYSSDAIKQHTALLEFQRKPKPIVDDESDEESREISQRLLRQKFSSVVFKVERFAPKKFLKAVPDTVAVQRAWLAGTREFFEEARVSEVGYLRPRKRNLVDIFVSKETLAYALDTANAHSNAAATASPWATLTCSAPN